MTLPVDTWQVVEKLAERLQMPKATILAELIDQALPAMQLMVRAQELAEEQPREVQRLVTNFGAEQIMKLQQQHLQLDAAVTKKLGGSKRDRTT